MEKRRKKKGSQHPCIQDKEKLTLRKREPVHIRKPGIRRKINPEVSYTGMKFKKIKSLKDHKFVRSAIKHFTTPTNQMSPSEKLQQATTSCGKTQKIKLLFS